MVAEIAGQSSQPGQGGVPSSDIAELSFADIDPAWHQYWGRTIKSAAARAAIADDPRFSTRLMASMANVDKIGIPEFRYLSDDDRLVYRYLMESVANAVAMSGLLWYANTLAGAVNRDDLVPIANEVNLESLRDAVRHRRVSPPPENAILEISRLPDMVRVAGRRCIAAWNLGMPMNVKTRVDFLIPPDFKKTYPLKDIHKSFAPRILATAADMYYGGNAAPAAA